MRLANRDVRPYVERSESFMTNNETIFSARASTEHTTLYIVYSYGAHFPMYICEVSKPGVSAARDEQPSVRWYENVDKYSSTTSRHKSYARPHGVEITEMTTESMLRIAESGIAGLAAMGDVTPQEGWR